MQLKVLRKGDLKDRVCVLVGTRPGIIKMSPIIKELERIEANYFVIHAGQHYSYNMDQLFFEELELSKPDYKLHSVKHCKLHGEQTAEMLKGIERVLIKEKPRIILVCGDANFNLAGALAGRKLHINVGHVEAGLRSNDWRMPEEHNRVIIDHISDYLFAPTEEARLNLIEDNIKGKIYVFGNTIVDAILQNIEIAETRTEIFKKHSLKPKEYFLLTIHREENVDFKETLTNIVEGIKKVYQNYPDYKMIFPIHPRTFNRLKNFHLLKELKRGNVNIITPLGYLDFLNLLHKAKLVLTDSGGIQEEACVLRTPCITLRESTERPETVDVGANIVVGSDPERNLEGVRKMMSKERDWQNPFGDGTTAQKIVDIILKRVLEHKN